MDFRHSSTLLAGQLIRILTKKTGSGGTAAPGLAALYLDKKILKKLAKELEITILISGTNGKTTTSRIIGNFLENNQIAYIHNRHGSNLERGLVSAFLDKVDFQGNLLAKKALFEVDEAALNQVLPKLSPTVIVITNLFRDQLDRYGEIDSLRTNWLKSLETLDSSTTLVLNADDPAVASLGINSRSKVVYFGIEDKSVKLTEKPRAVDSVKCPLCFHELTYSHYYISHQGDYRCESCGFSRPKPEIVAKKIELGKKGSEFILKDGEELDFNLDLPLAGLYNIYNSLASYGALKSASFEMDSFGSVLKAFKPVFGRTETIEMQGRNILVALAKNPTGFNEVIRTYLKEPNQTCLIVINDLIADGRDVSWLWDVDFENLKNQENKYFVAGIRAADMGLRLKYAQLKNVTKIENSEEALSTALDSIPQNDTLLIIPTYTAMLELRKLFAKKALSGEFWED